MSILEKLWCGEIKPTEYDPSPCKEYKELLSLVNRNEEKLRATMTDEQKALFDKHMECVVDLHALAECMLFQNSFRLGARIMVEVMTD